MRFLASVFFAQQSRSEEKWIPHLDMKQTRHKKLEIRIHFPFFVFGDMGSRALAKTLSQNPAEPRRKPSELPICFVFAYTSASISCPLLDVPNANTKQTLKKLHDLGDSRRVARVDRVNR